MNDEAKSQLLNGDQIVFKFAGDGWTAHVKFATGGFSGRAVHFKTFDEAVAAIEQDNEL